jgi:hypothetical protein
MADTKITQLQPPQVGYPVVPATDVLPIVVIADPGMATSGSTRKVTVNQILGSGGTATLASATITGDLTVDTSTLKVDSTNDRVGIKNASPTYTLDVTGTANDVAIGTRLAYGTLGEVYSAFRFNNTSFSGGNSEIRNIVNGSSTTGSSLAFFTTQQGGSTLTERYRLDTNGVATWSNVGGVAGTAMTLNATGLGVGTSPSYRIHSVVTSGFAGRFNSSTAVAGGILAGNSVADLIVGVDASGNGRLTADTSKYLGLGSNGINDRVILDSTGNVGISVTPSAWNNSYNVLEIGQNGSISGRTSANNQVDIVSNGFRNAGGTWVYKLATSNAAARYLVDGSVGGHFWYSGVAGTAGNTIAGFSTPAMTLDSSGNLILLSSNTPATLATNGQLTVNATSNTNLRFSYRGSDGTTRVANITLA